MYNWSTDTSQFKTAEAKERFELEQQVNFGLRGKRLSGRLLSQYWDELVLDPARRHFLDILLHDHPHTDANSVA